MARGLTLALAAVVAVQLAGATFDYDLFGTPLVIYPPTFYNAPDYFQPFLHNSGGDSPQAIRIAVERALPCPAEGFYANPTNCSQFYRCVDHIGTGQWFVRYVFECRKGHVFAEGVATCLPGTCDGTQPPAKPITPILPITPVLPPVQPPVLPVEPPVQPPIDPITPVLPPFEPPTDSPTDDMPTTLPPVDGTEPPQPPITDSPQPPVPDPPQPPTQPDPNCFGQYIQHEKFCNSYIRCNVTSQRYICPPGTVFDEPRQMCRISAGDESLCAGKTIAAFPYFLRAELVEGHILLPDDFVLRPLNPFEPQTLPLPSPAFSPFEVDLRKPLSPPIPGSVPANSPSLKTPANPSFSRPGPPPPSSFGSPSSSFSRPGSTFSPSFPFGSPNLEFSRPGSRGSSPSRSPFPASSPSLTFTGNQPSRSSPFSSLPADTQSLNVLSSSVYSPLSVPSPYSAGPLSINNVRRPSSHLHFPHFTPYGLPEYHPYNMVWRR
ncbi:uncharacterized protein LOC126996167 [Eriocheir sinensis]|uniref:uncharacterized protein LOC126996167 n=1 Tax=Eriocheir sinensis TaxID=95602 RepID=UPI0021C77376|nr:uncharacterized protein LOC126996167 [Eriocheir sinensis]